MFEELLKMRINAKEPKHTKFNILDFLPNKIQQEKELKQSIANKVSN